MLLVSSKIYDKRDDFNFEILNFPFLDGDVPRSPSYGVYISQLIRFARVCSNVDDFNNRNLFLTAKLLKQGYRYHKIQKAFSKFYHRHSELIVKYNIGLETLLQKSISETIFYGDLVYRFKRIVRKSNFSDQFKKDCKTLYNGWICLVLNPNVVYITLVSSLIARHGSGLRLYDGSDVKLKSVGWCLMLICSWTHRGSI